jgi:hypothetical protein
LHQEFNGTELQISVKFYSTKFLYSKLLSFPSTVPNCHARWRNYLSLFDDTLTEDILQKCQEGQPPITRWEMGKKGNCCPSMHHLEKNYGNGEFVFSKTILT